MQSVFYGPGQEGGTVLTGLLFTHAGSRITLVYYAVASAVVLLFFAAYIIFGKNVPHYELVSNRDSDSEDFEE